MREIKFRGKSLSNNTLVYGDLCTQDKEYVSLIGVWQKETIPYCKWIPVDENTVGQFTGLKDKNGIEIYEGDIMKSFIRTGGISEIKEGYAYGVVEYVKNGFIISEKIYEGDIKKVFGEDTIYGFSKDSFTRESEIIGNIYENPELLNKQ